MTFILRDSKQAYLIAICTFQPLQVVPRVVCYYLRDSIQRGIPFEAKLNSSSIQPRRPPAFCNELDPH